MTQYLRRIPMAIMLISALCTGQAGIVTDWPTGPIRIVLPYPPGGASDVTARLLGQKMGQAWGTTVIVENRPGGNGIIANEAATKFSVNGYPMLMANLGPNAINPLVYEKLPYNTLKDFAPVILSTIVPLVIVTSTNSPTKNTTQLIAMAKERPGQMTSGSPGNGSCSHLANELLDAMTVVETQHVPYKGDAPPITDVMRGQIAVALPTVLAGVPFVKSRKLRVPAVTSQKRIASLPNVPTVDEATGIKGYEAVSLGGFIVPSDTPVDVISKINAEVNKALKDDET